MLAYHVVASAVGDDLDLLTEELVVEWLGEQAGSLVFVFLCEVLLDVPRLVDGWSAIVENQDGEFLQRVVFWCLGRCVPRDFVLHLAPPWVKSSTNLSSTTRFREPGNL